MFLVLFQGWSIFPGSVDFDFFVDWLIIWVIDFLTAHYEIFQLYDRSKTDDPVSSDILSMECTMTQSAKTPFLNTWTILTYSIACLNPF